MSDADYWDLDDYERSDVELSAPAPERLTREQAAAEVGRMGIGDTIVIIHPTLGTEVEITRWDDVYSAQDPLTLYLEAQTDLEVVWALYGHTGAVGHRPVTLAGARQAVAGLDVGQSVMVHSEAQGYVTITRTAASTYRLESDDGKIDHQVTDGTQGVAAMERVASAVQDGRKPSLADHIILGTSKHLKGGANLPGPERSQVVDTPNLPDPDLIPRSTKPGVKPTAPAEPTDPSGDTLPGSDGFVEPNSTSDKAVVQGVQDLRVQVACANPGLSAGAVDALVREALVLAWRDSGK